MDLRDAASKKMKLGEFLKENVCYCVYGEYTWNECTVYDSQDSCHKISIPHFCDMKVVAVKNGVESVFVADEAVHIFNGFLTALQLRDEAYVSLYINEDLIRKNAALFELPACIHNNFEVPQFLYLDGEIYALFLCTDRHIFYFQDSVTLCYTWDKKRVSEGVIADITLGESEENLEIGEEKLIWELSKRIEE